MIRITLIVLALMLVQPVSAQTTQHHGHKAKGQHDHEDHDHGEHQHDNHHDNAQKSDDHKAHASAALSKNEKITAAVQQGGSPIVVKVLGVVCDFCAKAMDKTFGKRDEVAAVYVDLDTKTLNLVLKAEENMDDETITKLVKKAGYKVDKIYRGDQIVTGDVDATDPS